MVGFSQPIARLHFHHHHGRERAHVYKHQARSLVRFDSHSGWLVCWFVVARQEQQNHAIAQADKQAALLVRFAFTSATSCRWFACGWRLVAGDGGSVRALSAVVCARYLLLRATNQSLQMPSQTTSQPNQLPALRRGC